MIRRALISFVLTITSLSFSLTTDQTDFPAVSSLVVTRPRSSLDAPGSVTWSTS